jgi:glycosyltransferase involved in cell wall biosynthesis
MKITLINHVRCDGDFTNSKILFKLSDKIIVVSNTLKSSIESYFKEEELVLVQKKLYVVENGVEIPPIDKVESSSIVRIAFIGTICPVKGQLEFIKNVWPLISGKTSCQTELNIIGKPDNEDYFNELSTLIKKENYDNINILGLQRNMDIWYRQSDITINYSIHEGLPRVILESMSYGIAVVATDVVGNKDLINDGATGIIIDRKNHESAATKIINLIDSPLERRELAYRQEN